MDAPARPVIPSAPRVHPSEISDLRTVWELAKNAIGVWTHNSFTGSHGKRTVFGQKGMLLNDAEGVRQVLATDAARYVRPVASVRPVRPFAGRGVLLAEGTDWRRQRRVLAPMFTPARVGGLLPHFVAAAERLVDRIELGARINLSQAFHDAALDAVMRALFGLRAGERQGRLTRMVRDYMARAGRPNIFDGFARGEEDFAFAVTTRRRFSKVWFAEVDAIVAERRARGSSADARGDFLDLLLAARDPETGEGLSDAEIRDQCATMLAAGFETTSRMLFWTAYLLALDPAWQAQVRAELPATDWRAVEGLDDLSAWPKLRQSLFESLRLYPPVPILMRRPKETETVMGEGVPPDCTVWISPWVIHRHREYWEHPTAFVPERWAGKPHPFLTEPNYIPFGAGPRICIGASFALAEAQVMLAALVSRFEIVLDDDREVIPTGNVTIGPSVEPWFRMEAVG